MEKIYNIIFIIACTVYGGTVNGCPSVCRCTSTNVVYCSSRSLTTVPSNILKSTTLLYISNNNITLKDDYSFAGLSALKLMYINDNKITRINEHSFDGLSALTHLYINGNNITMIDGRAFDRLSAFTHLYLEGNTLDCSNCELKKFKAFLLTAKRVYVGGASCGNRRLIYHNFTNCKEPLTTEAFPSSSGKDNPESTTESITGNRASTTKNTSGMKQTQNIVYLSCGVGLFLILSCSIASFYVGKKYQSAQINKKSGQNQFININNGTEVERDSQMNPNIATRRGNGQDYAEIDELEMPDLSSSSIHMLNNDNSNVSSDRIRLPTDAYLNQYQSLMPHLQQPLNVNKDSYEYCNPDEENKAYTNLYQPLRSNQQSENDLQTVPVYTVLKL